MILARKQLTALANFWDQPIMEASISAGQVRREWSTCCQFLLCRLGATYQLRWSHSCKEKQVGTQRPFLGRIGHYSQPPTKPVSK